MVSKSTKHPTVLLGAAVLVMLFTFLAVYRSLPRITSSAPVAKPINETVAERTTRLGREQITKDWQAAQKRFDDREARGQAGPNHGEPSVLSTER